MYNLKQSNYNCMAKPANMYLLHSANDRQNNLLHYFLQHVQGDKNVI